MAAQVRSEDPERHWTSPGIFEVHEGVYRVPLPLPNDGLRAVNVYVLADDSGLVLVDGGWAIPAAEEALVSALVALDAGLGDIRRVLVTHAHRDHYSQAVAIRRRFGAGVVLGSGERPSLEAVIAQPHGYGETRRDRLGACGASSLAARLEQFDEEAKETLTWELPDRWLAPFERIMLAGRSLECIETPGHTRGHVVFHDEAATVLFAGDHLLPHITPSIGFERTPSSSPLSEYLGSLQLVLKLPDARLLPAHGPVSPSAHHRALEILEHHEERLEATRLAIAHGAETAYEVANQLRWTRGRVTLASLDDFNQLLAILETEAHLTVLCERDVLCCETVNGVHRYGTGSPLS